MAVPCGLQPWCSQVRSSIRSSDIVAWSHQAVLASTWILDEERSFGGADDSSCGKQQIIRVPYAFLGGISSGVDVRILPCWGSVLRTTNSVRGAPLYLTDTVGIYQVKYEMQISSGDAGPSICIHRTNVVERPACWVTATAGLRAARQPCARSDIPCEDAGCWRRP